MRFSVFTILAVVSATAFGQSLSGLPKCAQDCVGSGLSSTGCKTIDIGCICGSKDWIAQLSCCVANTCSAADQQATIQFADQLCATKGITTLPTVAGCSATSSGASSAPASTGNSTTATSSTTATATSSTSSSSATTSAASSASAASSSSGAGSESQRMGFGMAVAGLIAAIL